MANQTLVRVNKYSDKIKELPITKRISVDYPLLCRDDVVKKLASIANKLPGNLFLQVDSAYRTKATEKFLWNLRKDTLPWLAQNPQNGHSSHNTGGTVDVSLADEMGKEINLSEPFQKYYEEPQLISEKITPRAQELRILLNKVMVEEGFSPNPKEYWHFSSGKIYEEIELPKNQYYPLYLRLFFRVLLRLKK